VYDDLTVWMPADFRSPCRTVAGDTDVEMLSEMVTVADGSGTKSRFEQLLCAKEHEMHHRAQLMLTERQLGIVPHLTKQFNDRIAKMSAPR
jgi:uncharacterized damage-inducible protein DinB